MVARSRRVGEPRWSPDGRRLAWVEAFTGRADVLVAPADGSGPAVVATADTPPRSGGGAFTWAGPDRLVVAAADGRLVTVPADGGPGTTLSDDGRAAAPACSPDGRHVAFVVETDQSCAVAVVGTDGAGLHLVSDADYAWDPTWRPDGAQLAWHQWELPAMPWDRSEIVRAAPDGRDRRVVAGGADEAVGQPRWSPDGSRLAFVSDRSGWANVWVGDRDGAHAAPALPERCEQAEPTWSPGQRSFAWSPDGAALAANRNEDGFGCLVIVRGSDVETRARGWHHGLDWGTAGIVAVRSGARTPSAVTVLDPHRSRRVLARGPVGGFETAGLLEPEPVRWVGDDGTTVHGLLWRPPAATTPPPLLVDVHGGPTGQATVTWKPWPQYFASRGWAVLAPNGRGSTGYGRAYTQALAGEWGCLDVADVAAGIRHAGTHGWCDPDRVAVTGGSGGALTVLLLCAHHGDLVRAAVSMYGVTDLFDLAETTHRFESRYLERLVGALPDTADQYRDRSPVTHAAAIRAPVLVLHGDTDPVVPMTQTERLIGAMRAAGATIETRVYEGEGHGWSQPDTIADVYERSESFLRRTVLDP